MTRFRLSGSRLYRAGFLPAGLLHKVSFLVQSFLLVLLSSLSVFILTQ